MPDLYESAIAGAFVYRFAWRDARAKFPPANLILNAQNPLDELLGDLVGELEGKKPGYGRYFLIEFKQSLSGKDGFESEFSKSQRWHLHHLYAAEPRSPCHRLGLSGHFGVWRDKEKLRAAPYIHALLKIPGYAGAAGSPWPTDKELYWNLREQSVGTENDGLSFNKGLGLTAGGFKRYLACMFRGAPATSAASARQICVGRKVNERVYLAMGSFSSLAQAFERVERVLLDLRP